jgi:flavin reductase (DIM6/NTAB) family NADH-FMN oxidoreductase RutF
MKNLEPIPAADLLVRPHHLWSQQWLLLTAGDFQAQAFNTMTVGWGSLGTMWGKPFAQVVVRPGRHTRGFIDLYDTFTLCAFPENCRAALQILGSKSGRDGDKIAEAGLTPVASAEVAAPGFAEAELVLECRKIYGQEMDPAGFLDADIGKNYPARDYHRIYFGEIVAVRGTDAYRG